MSPLPAPTRASSAANAASSKNFWIGEDTSPLSPILT